MPDSPPRTSSTIEESSSEPLPPLHTHVHTDHDSLSSEIAIVDAHDNIPMDMTNGDPNTVSPPSHPPLPLSLVHQSREEAADSPTTHAHEPSSVNDGNVDSPGDTGNGAGGPSKVRKRKRPGWKGWVVLVEDEDGNILQTRPRGESPELNQGQGHNIKELPEPSRGTSPQHYA